VRAAEQLIDGIVHSSRVPPGKRRREIERELRAHIDDFVASAREAGRGQDEIERLVLANFGDSGNPGRPGLRLWRVNHERAREQAHGDRGARYHSLRRRLVGLTALESLFETCRFQKAAVLLAAIIGILMVSCAVASLHAPFLMFGLVNGIFVRAIRLWTAPKLARIGIIVVCFPLAGLVLTLLTSRSHASSSWRSPQPR
jgi:hypothetical protein